MTINGTNKIFNNQFEMEKESIQMSINSRKLKYPKIENLSKFVATDFLQQTPKNGFSTPKPIITQIPRIWESKCTHLI